MKLICKEEALNDDGTKIMEFTKGNVYDFTETEEEVWEVESDNGTVEEFFHTGIMFEKIK